MNTVESLGYLKGLLDGLDVDNKNGAQIYKAIVDVLDNIVDDIDDIHEEVSAVEEQLDAVDADLADLEDIVYDDDCCADDCCCDDDDEYEIKCPSCGEVFSVDGETVDEGGIECPKCGEYLEFDLDGDEETEE